MLASPTLQVSAQITLSWSFDHHKSPNPSSPQYVARHGQHCRIIFLQVLPSAVNAFFRSLISTCAVVAIVILYIWAALEGALVILAASIAALKPLFRKCVPSSSSSYESSANKLSNRAKLPFNFSRQLRSQSSRRHKSVLFRAASSCRNGEGDGSGAEMWIGQKRNSDQISKSGLKADKCDNSTEEISGYSITKTTLVEICRGANAESINSGYAERMV